MPIGEFHERLALAREPLAVSAPLAEECARQIGWSNYVFFAAPSGVRAHALADMRSQVRAPATDYTGTIVALDEQVGGIAAWFDLFRDRAVIDLEEFLPTRSLEGSELWERHWGPWECDKQICGLFRSGGELLGHVALVRTGKERPFDSVDLHSLDVLRAAAERATARLAVLGEGTLEETLLLLAASWPVPAFLFDRSGNLLWMSDEGGLRLAGLAAREGSATLVQRCEALDQMARAASAALADPSSEEPTQRLLHAGVIESGEQVVAREFVELTRRFLLLALASTSPQPTPTGGHEAKLPGLGAVESRVAWMAAEGFTVLNISLRLGISESTARTHLRRIYSKKGVHSRAQLAALVLHNRRAKSMSRQRSKGPTDGT
jgi:DNA-binding NarL/FixJ family response regulator